MSIPIQPNSIKTYDVDRLEGLQALGQAGVSLRDKDRLEKQASMNKVAGFTKEQQAQYWKEYFESANVMMDFQDWYEVLFG